MSFKGAGKDDDDEFQNCCFGSEGFNNGDTVFDQLEGDN